MIRAMFGGSFDPVHAGHVAVIDRLLADRLAETVHAVPARSSPLKPDACRAAPEVRLELLRLAVAGRAHVVVEDLELVRPGPSYTVDTLAELAGRHPGDRWRLIIGADQARAFDRWHRPGRLLELAETVVVARGPVSLAAPLAGRALVLDDFRHPASATAIRSELAAGRVPGPDLLPPAVAEAIRAAGLYGLADGRFPPATRGRS